MKTWPKGYRRLTLGCIVNMSNVRSVDSRRSSSVTGIDRVDVEARSTDVGAVS